MTSHAKDGAKPLLPLAPSHTEPQPDLEPPPRVPAGVPSQLSPAQVVALQRSAGNGAVTRLLQRAPDTITAKEQDELLILVLRAAAFRAHEGHGALEADKTTKARKSFVNARNDLTVQLDEALLLAARTAGGRSVFQAADSLFEAAIPFVKLAKSRSFGASGLQKRLSRLNVTLQKHGYRFPLARIESGKTAQPREPGKRSAVRAARLGFAAARTEMEAGLKTLTGGSTQLPGSRESVVHLQEAGRQLDFSGQFEDDTLRVVIRDLLKLSQVGLALLKQGAKLDGARALWDELNALNRRVGLDPLMPFGTLKATSRQDAAAERLEGMSEKRLESAKAGKEWTPDESRAQIGAEHEAVNAANEALSKAKHAEGAHLDVADVLQRVNADIDRIEIGRSVGFTDAVTFLSSQALDTPSNIRTFAQSLIGNFLWAASSFIPAVGVLSRMARFKGSANVQTHDAVFGAAVGLFGAMFAQFSTLPSGGAGDVSGRLDELKKGLKKANSQFCNQQRAQSYILLSRLMDSEPPKPEDDRAAYLASLETALRHVLYGDVFQKKLNDGARPDQSKVEAEAKREMLAAAAAPVAGVTEEGDLEATTPALDMDYAKKILKGAEKSAGFTFDPFDLVGSRVPIAAREMGCNVQVDARRINDLLAKGQPVEIPVSGWSWQRAGISQRTGATGSFTRWHELHREDRVWTVPDFTLARELDSASLNNITAIMISPMDLAKRTFHGKEIYTLERAAFSAVGGTNFSGMFRGSKSPDSFKMIYSFAEA